MKDIDKTTQNDGIDETAPTADAVTEADASAKADSGEGVKDKKKFPVGAVLALIPSLLCLAVIALTAIDSYPSFYDLKTFPRNMLIIMFLILIVSVMLSTMRPRFSKVMGWIVWALAPAGVMLLAEWIIRNPFNEKFTLKVILLNMAIYYIAAAFFLFITRSTFLSVLLASIFPLVLAVTNHYLMLFRGTVFFPWDLQSLGIAMTVVGNYEFDFPPTVALVIESFILIWQLAYFSRVQIFRSVKKMIVSFVCAFLCLVMGIGYAAYARTDDIVSRFKLYPYLFTPNTVVQRDGMMVSLFFSLKFMGVDKPDGYSTKAVSEIAEKYSDTSEDYTPSDVKPNIIAIMNEAWSDLSVDAPFEPSEDVFPITSQLTENTVKGYMYMSVLGGNTANSEFEFLTSSSMAFMPPGSVAYQQFVKHETPGLVSSLLEQGYQTVGMHSYLAKGWDRNKVYPYFGFEKTLFSEDFPKDAERVRSYISDSATFREIEKLYEARDESKPFFLFGVTMQNHGGYTGHYDDFENSITVKGLESSAALSQYLTLMRITDYAFGEIIDYFKNVDEPTIILMFGDHQPSEAVSKKLYANAGLEYPTDGDDQWNKYMVPFIIWANYDIEERTDVITSPNYLSSLLCESAGLELTGYQKFLNALGREYPVVTSNFFIDADGVFHTVDEMDSIDVFNEYKTLQYNQIIDWKNRVTEVFSVGASEK